MKRVLGNLVAVIAIAALSLGVGLLSLDPLVHMGLFGACFEGACGYAAAFVGLPIIWLVLTAAGCAAWFRLRRGRRK